MKEITQIKGVRIIRITKVEKDVTVFLKEEDRQKLMIKGTIRCKDCMTSKGRIFHPQGTDLIEMKKIRKTGRKIHIDDPLGRIRTIRFFFRKDL